MEATGMAPAHNPEALLRRWFYQVWNHGSEEAIDELFPEDSIMWGIGRPESRSQGATEFKQFYRGMRTACPDVNITLDQVIEQGDSAFARWTATMTHSGEGLGIAPTNKAMTIWGMTACRARDGKIIEGWNIWDQMGMARQLGLLQGPAATLFP
jgi:steroid delta-isomerase-like uncharacterized protein